MYLAAGWALVVLHHVTTVGGSPVCSCGNPHNQREHDYRQGGKHPIGKSWQHAMVRVDTPWLLNPAANVGIVTGEPSGIWVLDYDPAAASAAGQDLAARIGREIGQPTVLTGGRGAHWYLRMPADGSPVTNERGNLPEGWDVRGTGGQVVAPPSVSAKGEYLGLHEGDAPFGPVYTAPEWIMELVRPAPVRVGATAGLPPTGTGAPGSYPMAAAAAGITRECEAYSQLGDGRRGEAVWHLACRLVELANGAGIGHDWAFRHFSEAVATARDNSPGGLADAEAYRTWERAVAHVGGRAAVAPPAGEDVPWPDGRPGVWVHPHSGPAVSGTAGPIRVDPVAVSPGLILPSEFWDARPVLKHIRNGAHARVVSADVALHTVLARLAAQWPHAVRADTGVKGSASINYFAAIVGPSGAGKTTGVEVSEALIGRAPWLAGDAFAERPLGSGEGLAESFMGNQDRPVLDEFGVPIVMRTGEPKTKTIRAQTRHNVLVTADEGAALTALLERAGATIGETLRRAWVGSQLGQSNGRAETTRIIDRGTYSMGMIIGFQRETVQPLLADSAAGTPQRFGWVWAVDPTVPDEPVPDPGPLPDLWAPVPLREAAEAGIRVEDASYGADLTPVTFDDQIRAELRREHLAVTRGQVSVAELDAHRPLYLVKVSVLLAALDQRRHVTAEDWKLAQTVWETSCRVRDHLIAFGRQVSAQVRQGYVAEHVEKVAAGRAVEIQVEDAAEDAAVVRIARRLAIKVHDAGGQVTRKALREGTHKRDRGNLPAALTYAVDAGWLLPDGAGYLPGASRPS